MTNTASARRIEQAAALLLAARRGGAAAPTAELAALLQDPEDAFQVQEAVARALGDTGAPRFWKSGGPSRSAPLTHAPLPSAGVRSTPASMADIPFRHRFVEAEVALRLGAEVTPAQAATLTHEQAKALIASMTVTIEVVDARTDQAIQSPALVKLADQQLHGALAVGEWKPWQCRDWESQRCTVRVGSAEPKAFTGTHSLRDPSWLLPAWLRHATRNGATVPAGTAVTTGTWCGLVPAQAGDLVEVEFPGIGKTTMQL